MAGSKVGRYGTWRRCGGCGGKVRTAICLYCTSRRKVDEEKQEAKKEKAKSENS